MKRQVTNHHIGDYPHNLLVFTLFDDGQDPSAYLVQAPDVPVPGGNPPLLPGRELGVIRFQRGPIPEAGVNGMTNEVLLAMVRDRLEQFQKGKHACVENDQAIAGIDMALLSLKERTARRPTQGTEGTMTGS